MLLQSYSQRALPTNTEHPWRKTQAREHLRSKSCRVVSQISSIHKQHCRLTSSFIRAKTQVTHWALYAKQTEQKYETFSEVYLLILAWKMVWVTFARHQRADGKKEPTRWWKWAQVFLPREGHQPSHFPLPLSLHAVLPDLNDHDGLNTQPPPLCRVSASARLKWAKQIPQDPLWCRRCRDLKPDRFEGKRRGGGFETLFIL